jgi:hypothetical protein
MRRIGSQSGAALEGEGHRQKLRDRFDALRRMHAKAKSWSARSLYADL